MSGNELVAEDALTLDERLLNGDGLQWNCSGTFDATPWAAKLQLQPNNTAVYTFETGQALMATWVLDSQSRDITWDVDFDGQADSSATLDAPILNVATDSFHNIRETFTDVEVSAERVLSMTRAKIVDGALLTGDMTCLEQI